MPLTVTQVNKPFGHFLVVDESGKTVGAGRAKASTVPGMVTLFFPNAVRSQLGQGLRVPIDWLDS